MMHPPSRLLILGTTAYNGVLTTSTLFNGSFTFIGNLIQTSKLTEVFSGSIVIYLCRHGLTVISTQVFLLLIDSNFCGPSTTPRSKPNTLIFTRSRLTISISGLTTILLILDFGSEA